MSDHLIWRLRKNDTAKHLCGLAADEIERLRAALGEIAGLEIDTSFLADHVIWAKGLARETLSLTDGAD